MNVFVPCWGKKHIDLFKRSLARSLSWPRNAKAMAGCTFYFVCEEPAEADDLVSHLRQLPFVCKGEAFLFPPEMKSPRFDRGIALVYPLLEMIRECLRGRRPLLMATPDFIYGDGTIAAFQAMGSEPGSCVSIAHLRVLPEILDMLYFRSNAAFMSLGLQFAHRSWTDQPRNFHKGGVKHWETAPATFAVQHFMPSPFYVNFIRDDLKHFGEKDPLTGMPPGFGMWDHLWPSRLLEAGRLRYIGSSDIACMLEVTDADKNVAPIEGGKTEFFRTHFHNKTQGQFISCFRGET